MTMWQAIAQATKAGFKRGGSVRFGYDRSVYSVLREGRGKYLVLYVACAHAYGDDYSIPDVPVRTVTERELKPLCAPEPEEQEGFE